MKRPAPTGGFTLLEMIVAISILVIIAGAAVPALGRALERAAYRATHAELEVLRAASGEFFRDTGALPDTVLALEQNPGVAGWAGPYLSSLGIDPTTGESHAALDAWSRPYRLAPAGSTLRFTSAGLDGVFGTGEDPSLVLDVTPLRRAATLAQLEILNGAIARYNEQRGTAAPLPLEWSALLRRLVQARCLPDSGPYERDGWLTPFEPDPPDRLPVVRARSRHLARD